MSCVIVLVVLFLYCCVHCIASTVEQQVVEQFSGLYSPNVKNVSEDFAGAFLVSKFRFLNSERSIGRATNMAGVSFSVIRDRCSGCRTLLTRDYLDFLVEHLSSTSNQIPRATVEVFNVFIDRLQNTVLGMRNSSNAANVNSKSGIDFRAEQQTLAVLVFSSNSFSTAKSALQSQIRRHMFEATFWSVHRYFPHVVVYVGSRKDRDTVLEMQLPAIDIVQLDVHRDAQNRTVLLPRSSLLDVMVRLRRSGVSKEDEALSPWWSGAEQFRYVYFTEGDQILHTRAVRCIFDAIDDSEGRYVVVPHRMQTLPLVKDLPVAVQKYYASSLSFNQPNATVITESPDESTGSCCDAGRFEFEKCGAWWYKCPDWGLSDAEAWLKFGDYGFTMPTITEHQGTCAYSSERQLCDIPNDCARRSPFRDRELYAVTYTDSAVCGEIPLIRRVGAADRE